MNRFFVVLKTILLLCVCTVIYVNSGCIEAMLIFSGLCGVFLKRLSAAVVLSSISAIIMSAFGDGIFLVNMLANVYFSITLFLFGITNPSVSGIVFFCVVILTGVAAEMPSLFCAVLNALIFKFSHQLLAEISFRRQNRIF